MRFVPLKAMFLRFLFYAFLAYMLYKLVFGLILPLYRTTRQIKKGFREMNERMHQQMQQPGPPPPAKESRPSSAAGPAKGDYIDFEEVK